MRKLKFRAWDKITHTMRTMDHPNYTIQGAPFRTKCFGDLQWFFSEFSGDYKIMQFIGIKDKKGKEIFEGDLVRRQSDYQKHLAVVEVKRAISSRRNGWNICVGENFEVIGNIYENPELLK